MPVCVCMCERERVRVCVEVCGCARGRVCADVSHHAPLPGCRDRQCGAVCVNGVGCVLLSLLSCTGLADTHSDRVAALWRAQVIDLSQAAVDASLMVNQLVDMEWRFGVTAASDEIEKVCLCGRVHVELVTSPFTAVCESALGHLFSSRLCAHVSSCVSSLEVNTPTRRVTRLDGWCVCRGADW